MNNESVCVSASREPTDPLGGSAFASVSHVRGPCSPPALNLFSYFLSVSTSQSLHRSPLIQQSLFASVMGLLCNPQFAFILSPGQKDKRT